MIKKIIGVLFLTILVILCGWCYITYQADKLYFTATDEKLLEEEKVITEEHTATTKYIDVTESTKKEYRVYICGEVNNAMVVAANEGDRVVDIIELAGGVTQEAELEKINLAAFIYDGQKIYVPKFGETVDKNAFTSENTISDVNQLVNLNTASLAELMTISGIGEVTAKNIIEYRQNNGGFNSIEEIMNVKRIGEKTFEKIKTYITV